MKLFIELYQLQHMFGCPCRDDTNQIKTVMYGNAKRARWSSQSEKYAANSHIFENNLLTEDLKSERTRQIESMVTTELLTYNKQQEEAVLVAHAACSVIVNVKGAGGYLLFVSRAGVVNLTNACLDHWDSLLLLGKELQGEETEKKKSKKELKAIVTAFSKDNLKFVKLAKGLYATGNAPSIWMLGRMVADKPEFSVESALQQSHAFTTNQIQRETDFYVAMDTVLKQAGMMDHQSFASGCYYKYSCIDMGTLLNNSGGLFDLSKRTALAYVEALIKGMPSAKRNSFANSNLPDFVMVILRNKGCNVNLSNAFIVPVKGTDLVSDSLKRLSEYWNKMQGCYPDDFNVPAFYYSTIDGANSKWNNVESLNNLLLQVGNAIDALKE